MLGMLHTQAQFRVGILGGVQRASVPGNGSPLWDNYSYTYQSRDGYRFGVIADWHLAKRSPFYLQSGMYYSMKGRNLSTQISSGSTAVSRIEAEQYLNYLEMPLYLTMKFRLGNNTKITFGGGPYAGFLYSGKEMKNSYLDNGSIQTQVNEDLKTPLSSAAYNNLEYGVAATFGYEVGRFIINGQLAESLNDFANTTVAAGKYKHRTMSVGVGFYLNKTKSVTAAAADKSSKSKKDRDKDGVADVNDQCPGQAGSAATKGCPDADGDGIADREDSCPGAAGVIRYKGCPVPDADKDGINDEDDQCPQVVGVGKYNGCPVPDTDKDGINDEEDQCPAIAGAAKYKGCAAPDSDNDGLNDEEDKCPKTYGLRTNDGCPLINKAVVKKAEETGRKIQFDYKSVTLTADSKKALDEFIVMLKQQKDLKLVIEGHTSKDGNPNNHMVMSQVRANSVRNYLIAKGIPASRLKAVGFGSSRPVINGNAPQQLARNRRVELKLTNAEAF